MIEETRQQIRNILAEAKAPALFCSFGKDSLLLLHLAREAGFTGAIYYFGEELTETGKKMVIEDDLTVFSWPASDRYLIPNGNELALVDEYLVGTTLVPSISRVVKGNDCSHGEFQQFLKPFHYPHDITLTGYKQGETCEAIGISFDREIDIGTTKLVAPLFDWTDDDVFAALETLGIEPPPSDNEVEFCDECLNLISISDWDRDAALAGFRSRFNFNH